MDRQRVVDGVFQCPLAVIGLSEGVLVILHPVEFYLVGAIVLFRQSDGKIADHIPIGQGEAEIQGEKSSRGMEPLRIWLGLSKGSVRAIRLFTAPSTREVRGKKSTRATRMASTKFTRESTSHRRGKVWSRAWPTSLASSHGGQGVGLGFLRVPAGLHQGVGVVGQVVLEFLGHGLLLFRSGVAEAGTDGLGVVTVGGHIDHLVSERG